ncbi:TonB-dependent receptor domain-containing protein [candidate division CSSED10-310 bacterium]|uniref:TonB-dependent receptor domain-containing protein n=1 Tax=candidate division CSSED10-310 bacterium TaxID=2855610 RepID=A0ABV6YS30_UNCC1
MAEIKSIQRKFFCSHLLLLIMIWQWPNLVGAQENSAVEVFILHEETQALLQDARIEIQSLDMVQTSNVDGRALFRNIAPGRYRLRVTLDGYHAAEQQIQVEPLTRLTVEVMLSPQSGIEEEITVVPAEFEVGKRAMSPITISNIPGAAEDPFKAMQTTPGVLAISEADSRLYIRGSPPSENLILMDGVPIYDPYRLFGLVTLFDPETVSYFTIWPGGFPARYGNRLSAVVEVHNRYGTTDDLFAGSVDASFTNTSLLAEGKLPLSTGSASWMLTLRRTYYDVMLNALNTGPSKFPYFFDVQGRLFYSLSEKHEFSFFSIFSMEGTDLSEEMETEYQSVELDFIDDQEGQVYGFHHYFHLSPELFFTTTLSLYQNEQQAHGRIIVGTEAFITEILLDLRTREWLIQEDLEFALTSNHTLEAGILYGENRAQTSIGLFSEDPAITIPEELEDFRAHSDNEKIGLYLQDQWAIGPEFEVGLGIRYDKETLSGFNSWSPRFNFFYNLGDHKRLKGSWGLFYHFPSYESLQGDGLLFDLDNIDELNLKPEQASHYVLGFEDIVPGNYRWSVEVYRKEMQDLIAGQDVTLEVLVLNDDGSTSYRTVDTVGIIPENSEQGYAQGIEFLFQKEKLFRDKLNLQFSYSLAETRAHKEGDPWHYRWYDQRHTAHLTGEFKFSRKWRLNFVWRFGSGFPYSPPGEILTLVEDTDGNGKYNPLGGERLSYLEVDDPDKQNSLRFPPYHRLDARINYKVTRPSFTATFYLDVINVYDRENIQSYEYSKDYKERKEVGGFPFLPSFGVHLKF